VARAATVSLIDAGSNQTLATTLTDANGAFSLDVKAIPAQGKVFYLEGVKGLRDNAVSADAIRVRTFISYDFTNQYWQSITNLNSATKLRINASTTALTIVTSLRQGTPNAVDPATVLGKLQVVDGNPPTETYLDPTGAATKIAQADLDAVKTLVNTSLTADADPFDAVLLKGGQYVLRTYVASAGNPVSISFVSPSVASPGDTVLINGWGFETPGSVVTFAPGIVATLTNATATKLTVIVPGGARSGLLTVQTGAASSSAPITINAQLSGGFNP